MTFTFTRYPSPTPITTATTLRDAWIAAIDYFSPYTVIGCHLDETSATAEFSCHLPDGTVEIYQIQE